MKKIFKTLANIILQVLLFIIISCSIIIFGINNSFSRKNIKSTIKETINYNINNIKTEDINNIEESNNLFEDLYSDVSKFGVSREEMDVILTDENFHELATEVIYSSISGENTITEENSDKIIDEIVDKVNSKTNIKITEDQKTDIKKQINSNINNINIELTEEDNGILYLRKILNILSSRKLKILSITSIIVISILIILINIDKFVWLRKLSLTSLLASIWIVGFINVIIPIIRKTVDEATSNIIKQVISPLNNISISISIISLVLFIGYFILKKVLYNKDNKIENID